MLQLRLLVGFLGERAQFAWWPTAFFEQSSRLFLEPVFPKTSRLAQYHGVLEAARRIHDEHLSVGSFHLFRLREEVEQDLHTIVQGNVGEKLVSQTLQSKDAALEALKRVAAANVTASVGPVAIGSIKELESSRVLHADRGRLLIGFLSERHDLSLLGELAVAKAKPYTTQLQAGLGLVNETKALLDLWSPGMSANQLHNVALESGRFPTVTARRLRNIVVECFGPRYLAAGGAPAAHLKRVSSTISTADLTQLMLVFTSRANPIFGDFVRQVYWGRYAAGYTQITNDDARAFVQRGIDDGRTAKRWSETTVRRVSAYLTGCCADYGMLERGLRSSRHILPFRISSATAAYLGVRAALCGCWR